VNTRRQLDAWLASGAITAAQHAAIGGLVHRDRVSAFLELNALLYLGVVAIAGGLAWTAQAYSDQWGAVAILAPITAMIGGCLYYCFSRATPYTSERAESASLAFDYVLYLACLGLAVELTYIEYRWHWLAVHWDRYLLASAFVYFGLAYRFDNRFVLSLAISTLGAWFGVRLSQWLVFAGESTRNAALLYAAMVGIAGVVLHRQGIKKHFLETYLHVAANVMLAALMAGALAGAGRLWWTAGLLVAAAAVVTGGVRFRRFAFVVYGVGYGYLGLSGELLRHVGSLSAGLAYLVISGSLVLVGLIILSRRFGREP